MFPKDIIERIKLPFKKNKKLYSSFYKILGFYPNDIQYYEQALLHKSSSIKKQGNWINNERLEFLGDAILDAVVGDIVYRHFKGKREGFLTNTRSKIVQRETLNKLAVEIGLDKLIIYSSHNTTHNNYMYGNAFEALIGAIYLDRGYDFCMQFMKERIMHRIINIDQVAYKEVNFKSKLIEWSQKNHVSLSFKLLEQSVEGQSTPVFVTQVVIEDVGCSTGKGYSKKESQQNAAKETLAELRKSPKFAENLIKKAKNKETAPVEDKNDTDFDLSEITIKKDSKNKNLNKEDIISAAEAAAFEEETRNN